MYGAPSFCHCSGPPEESALSVPDCSASETIVSELCKKSPILHPFSLARFIMIHPIRTMITSSIRLIRILWFLCLTLLLFRLFDLLFFFFTAVFPVLVSVFFFLFICFCIFTFSYGILLPAKNTPAGMPGNLISFHQQPAGAYITPEIYYLSSTL